MPLMAAVSAAAKPQLLLSLTLLSRLHKYVDWHIIWTFDVLRWTPRLDRLRNDWPRLQDGQDPRNRCKWYGPSVIRPPSAYRLACR